MENKIKREYYENGNIKIEQYFEHDEKMDVLKEMVIRGLNKYQMFV